jgi:hypothetical protein
MSTGAGLCPLLRLFPAGRRFLLVFIFVVLVLLTKLIIAVFFLIVL